LKPAKLPTTRARDAPAAHNSTKKGSAKPSIKVGKSNAAIARPTLVATTASQAESPPIWRTPT
jgi:hypothetical protein